MRYLFGFMCVLALGVMGCSETAGTGGSGGTAGSGGDGGSAGVGGVAGDGGASGAGGSMGDVFPCTEQGIRDAIAEGGGPHTFDCDDPQTVVTAEEIVIDNDVILDGEQRLTIDGNEDHRLFTVAEGVTAELHGLSVTRGSAIGGDGGGLRNEGTLTLDGTAISGNTATHVCDATSGCSGGQGAGVSNTGILTLIGSSVSGNSAELNGGGVSNAGTTTAMNTTVSGNIAGTSEQHGGAGGGIASYGTLTLSETMVSGNTAGAGGGIWSHNGTTTLSETTVSSNAAQFDGGGIFNVARLELSNTTVSENTAGRSGGGIGTTEGTTTLTNSALSHNTANQGGGVSIEGNPFHSEPIVTLTNSTVSGNIARNASVPSDGADRGGGIRLTFSTLTMINSTVSGNTAEETGGGIGSYYGRGTLINITVSGNAGGAISALQQAPNYSLTLARSLVHGRCEVEDILGNVAISNGYNIESPDDTCGFDQVTDNSEKTAEELNLGALQGNGGPTMTHALLTDPVISVAIDQIPEADCVGSYDLPLAEDQRGEPRPAGAESKCDVGSFEVQEEGE